MDLSGGRMSWKGWDGISVLLNEITPLSVNWHAYLYCVLICHFWLHIFRCFSVVFIQWSFGNGIWEGCIYHITDVPGDIRGFFVAGVGPTHTNKYRLQN